VVSCLYWFHRLILASYAEYRDKIKEIKKLHDQLTEVVAKHKQVSDKLAKAIQQKKPSDALQTEETALAQEELILSANFESTKRALLKTAINTQCDGWTKLANSIKTMATFQKHLADQIPQGSLQPGQELPLYVGAATTKMIFRDFEKAMSGPAVESSAVPKAASTPSV
jgi:uncharacterized protein YdcH (DUF465 family)